MPPVQARQAPAPPSGPTPRTQVGKVDFSGVWAPATTRLTERYRRPDRGHLNVDLTIDDAEALTRPYSFTRVFTLAPEWELQEYVCQAILDGVY